MAEEKFLEVKYGEAGQEASEELEENSAESGAGEGAEETAGQGEAGGKDEFDAAREEVASQKERQTLVQEKQKSGGEQTVLSADADKKDPARVIEAALFLSNKPLSYADMALIAKTSVKKAKEIAERLSQEYADRDTSIEMVCDSQQAMMQVKGDFLAPVAQLSKNVEMSRKATRMLALVAKKGKLLQSDLKKYFRGDIYAYIAELKELGYVSSEKKGNTRLLKVTEKFRENFQLGSTGAQALEAAVAKAEAEAAVEEARQEAAAETEAISSQAGGEKASEEVRAEQTEAAEEPAIAQEASPQETAESQQ